MDLYRSRKREDYENATKAIAYVRESKNILAA